MKTPKKTASKVTAEKKSGGVKSANSTIAGPKSNPLIDEDDDLEMPLDDGFDGLGYNDYDDEDEY